MKGKGSVYQGDNREKKLREPNNKNSLYGDVYSCLAASVLKDVVSVPLNNIICEQVSKAYRVSVILRYVRRAINITGSPKHISPSNTMRRLRSMASYETFLDDETISRCLQMQRVAKGRANEAPTRNLVADKNKIIIAVKRRE